MQRGKNFNLFLMDGEVTGRIKCTLSNWTGVAYKIPRTYLDKCKDRIDMKQSGVYFLFSSNENDENEVYIGQAGIRKNGEGIFLRVYEHLKDEYYFNEVVIITTQNNYFGPTEISYLENRFTNMAINNNRFNVRNNNEPNIGNVTEEKESELEEFIDYSKIILGVLGYKLFVPILNNNSERFKYNFENKNILFINRKLRNQKSILKAKCLQTNEGYVLLKGSQIELTHNSSIPKKLLDLRNKLIKTGKIKDGITQENLLFNSPSYASSFVLGRSSNGKIDWRTKEGLTINKLEELI